MAKDYDPPSDWSEITIKVTEVEPPKDWSETEILLKEQKDTTTFTVTSETVQYSDVYFNSDVSQTVDSSIVDVDSLTTTLTNVQTLSVDVSDSQSVSTSVELKETTQPDLSKNVSTGGLSRKVRRGEKTATSEVDVTVPTTASQSVKSQVRTPVQCVYSDERSTTVPIKTDDVATLVTSVPAKQKTKKTVTTNVPKIQTTTDVRDLIVTTTEKELHTVEAEWDKQNVQKIIAAI